MVRKLIVEQHDGSDLARRARAALTHGDADVGALQRGHVVHPVSGHGNDLSGGGQGPHEVELLSGDGARHHVEILQAPPAGSFQLGPLDDPRSPGAEADLARDGGRRRDVVSRHHDDPDAGGLRLGDASLTPRAPGLRRPIARGT